MFKVSIYYGYAVNYYAGWLSWAVMWGESRSALCYCLLCILVHCFAHCDLAYSKPATGFSGFVMMVERVVGRAFSSLCLMFAEKVKFALGLSLFLANVCRSFDIFKNVLY